MHILKAFSVKSILFFISVIFLIPSSHAVAYPVTTPRILLRNVPFSVKVGDVLPGSTCILQLRKDSAVIFEKTIQASQKGECEWKDLTVGSAGVVQFRFTIGGRAQRPRRVRVIPGWISLLPPLLAVFLAILTRQVILSLVAGVWIGATIISGWAPFAGFLRTLDRYIINAYADRDHVYIICFSLLLGGMVGIISRSGGTLGLVEALRKFARSARKVQFITWLMGVFIFFDDYANTLFVGTSMRPLADRFRVSREKLSYLIDTTAAPVANIALISTWIGFEVSIIGDIFHKLGIQRDPYLTFLQSIPYRFYPIMALILPLLLIVSRRDFGPMYRAERRSRKTGAVLAPEAVPLSDFESQDLMPLEHVKPRWPLAMVPIVGAILGILIGLLTTGYIAVKAGGGVHTDFFDLLRDVLAEADSFRSLLWGAAFGCLVAGTLALVVARMTLHQVFDAWIAGMRAMFLAVIILGLAWAIGSVCGDILTADYLVHFLGPHLPIHWIPALTTLVSALISFATGSSWTTMGIVMPLVIPLVHIRALSEGVAHPEFFLIATISSVLAGATFGDHCSPISDTTILSSIFSGSDHIDHVRTQIPYALLAGLVGWVFGDWLTAYGFPWWGAILIGTLFMYGFIRLFGKEVPDAMVDEPSSGPPVNA